MNKFVAGFRATLAKNEQNCSEPWILTIKNSVLQALSYLLGSFCRSLLTIPQNYFEWWPNFWTPWMDL